MKSHLQLGMPLTRLVKVLLIVNVGIWFFFQVIVEPYILHASVLENFLALRVSDLVHHYYFWQPVTYMFLHSRNVSHILFNMLMLWWAGSELENHLGSVFFGWYYFICGLGAAIIYTVVLIVYGLFSGQVLGWDNAVIGASGAIFGLLVAYGVLFGERVVYFMMIFPMKARFLVMLLAGLLVVNLLNEGIVGNGGVAHLAHLGGAITGFLALKFWIRMQRSGWRRQGQRKGGRRLRLVVDNRSNSDPKYWN